jgi:HK97 family phage prohead protease
MTRQQIRGYAVRADDARYVTFLASAPDKARDGLSIPTEAWDLTNFRANPIILFAHQYNSLPIGRAASIEATTQGLVVDVEFDRDDPDSARIEGKVRRGYLNAVSVGFEIKDLKGDVVTRSELLEISVVPVPADPKALAMARSAFQRARSSVATRVDAGHTDEEQAVVYLHLWLLNQRMKRQETERQVRALVREVAGLQTDRSGRR